MEDMEIAVQLRNAVARRVGQERMELWLGHEGAFRKEGELLIVSAWDEFSLERLRRHMRVEISAAVESLLGDAIAIEYRVDPASRRTKAARRTEPAKRRSAPVSPDQRELPFAEEAANAEQTSAIAGVLRPLAAPQAGRRFARLEAFVSGDANRLAFAAASSLAGRLGEISPLYFHGPTGSGKTHLLEGIWSSVKRSRAENRCLFLTAEQFTTSFLEALHGKGLAAFRRKHREVDLLILDDVQFFSGKKATLQELLSTVDYFTRERKQLVLAADRLPSELAGLGAELPARLAGGLTAYVKPPEADVRRELISRLAAERTLGLSPEVLELLVTELPADGRRIQGAIHLLNAVRDAFGKQLTVSLVRESLRDQLVASRRSVRIADVERSVCDVFGIEPNLLRQESKSRQVTQPRMLAMWLARKHTHSGLSEIREHFQLKSHSSVVAAEKKVTKWLSDAPSAPRFPGCRDIHEAIERVEDRLRICG